MRAAEFVEKLQGAKETANGWEARCPAHDDAHSSLSIGTGDDGRILLHCHAGCHTDEILKRLGLKTADLFPERGKPRVVATYEYKNEIGALLYVKRRYEPGHNGNRKSFAFYDANGLPGLNGARHVLYNLQAVRKADVVYVVEGEKDADTLIRLGLCATTNDGGAGHWSYDYGAKLTGKRIVILPDNDEPGRKHAAEVAQSCMGRCPSIKVVTLPGLPDKGDVSDWITCGGTVDRLLELCASAPEYPNKKETDPSELVDVVDWKSIPPKATEWVIGGIVPQGSCVILGAEMKTGKTWLTVEMALAVATGGKVLSRFPAKRGRVLIYSPEGSPANLARRLWQTCWGENIPPEATGDRISLVQGSLYLDDQEHIGKLRNTITALKPSLLILDPLISLYRGVDENSTELHPLLQDIRSLHSANPDMAIVICHHVNKAAKDHSAFHALRGTSAIGAWADGLLLLRREGDERDSARRLDAWHRDDPSPDPAGFRLRSIEVHEVDGLSGMRLEACDVPELGSAKPSGGRNLDKRVLNQIVALVAELPATLTRYQGADKLGMDRKKFNRYFKHLESIGRLSTDSYLRMVVADGGETNCDTPGSSD